MRTDLLAIQALSHSILGVLIPPLLVCWIVTIVEGGMLDDLIESGVYGLVARNTLPAALAVCPILWIIACLLDLLAYRRRLRPGIYFALDACITMGLISILIVVTLSLVSDGVFGTETVLAHLLSGFIAAICVGQLVSRIRAFSVGQLRYDDVIEAAPGTAQVVKPKASANTHIFGTSRPYEERQLLFRELCVIFFDHSLFRKHSFEPTLLAFIRGALAVYSCVGLAAFAWTTSSSLSGQYSIGVNVGASGYYPDLLYVSAVTYSATNGSIFKPPSDLNISRQFGFLNGSSASSLCSSMDESTFQCKTLAISGEPGVTTGVTLTWNTSQVLSVRIMDTYRNNVVYAFSAPSLFMPNVSVVGSLRAVVETLDGTTWTRYVPELMVTDPSANSGQAMSSVRLLSAPVANSVTLPVTTETKLALLGRVLSNLGGVWTFVNGIYTIIFGRSIMAILFGTRPISPFGMSGIISRERYRGRIRSDYPLLEDDCARGGMASFVKDVAVDVGFIDGDTIRRRTPAQRTQKQAFEQNADEDVMLISAQNESSTLHRAGSSIRLDDLPSRGQ